MITCKNLESNIILNTRNVVTVSRYNCILFSIDPTVYDKLNGKMNEALICNGY